VAGRVSVIDYATPGPLTTLDGVDPSRCTSLTHVKAAPSGYH
jgi:hypothetical protein